MEEEDEIQAQACKFPRVGNDRNESNKIVSTKGSEEEDGELRRRGGGGGGGGGGGSDGSTNRFHSSTWHQSSRIIRVSRASGGKDRHSKVMTSKGLRDRRVRLSVTTAIQFYDLQDRLGYDQPSKAVEWLIKAAADAISELPSLNTTFPETPKQPSDEKRPSTVGGTDHQQGFDEVDGDTNSYHHQQNQSHNLSLSKSACSSTSETSKGSGLSLSRSEIRVNRVKARERARERAAKEKEKESSHIAHHHHNVNPMSQTASFTELLTGGIGSTVTVPTTASPNGSVHQIHGGDEPNLFNKATTTATTTRQQWSSTVTPMVMDYFNSGLLVGASSSSRTHQSSSSGFSTGQIQLGNISLPVSPFSAENHSDQLQQFSFIPDHLMPPAVVTSSQPSGSDYNLNFTISSGLAAYNRGTLQSNSPSHILPHLQRFSSPIDGSNVPFFIGAAPASAAPTMDNHQHHLQFSPVFDGRLQLCYGDGSRHSDQKGKGKN